MTVMEPCYDGKWTYIRIVGTVGNAVLVENDSVALARQDARSARLVEQGGSKMTTGLNGELIAGRDSIGTFEKRLMRQFGPWYGLRDEPVDSKDPAPMSYLHLNDARSGVPAIEEKLKRCLNMTDDEWRERLQGERDRQHKHDIDALADSIRYTTYAEKLLRDLTKRLEVLGEWDCTKGETRQYADYKSLYVKQIDDAIYAIRHNFYAQMVDDVDEAKRRLAELRKSKPVEINAEDIKTARAAEISALIKKRTDAMARAEAIDNRNSNNIAWAEGLMRQLETLDAECSRRTAEQPAKGEANPAEAASETPTVDTTGE